MQVSEADSLLNEPPRKRKADGVEENEEDEETKTRCPCPICGITFAEEDINSHLDICLNRSTVLELVRQSDKLKGPKVPVPKRKPRKRR